MELNEKDVNAQLARNFIIALPKELSLEENKELIRESIQENFVSKGMIVDLAIHKGNDEKNGKSKTRKIDLTDWNNKENSEEW